MSEDTFLIPGTVVQYVGGKRDTVCILVKVDQDHGLTFSGQVLEVICEEGHKSSITTNDYDEHWGKKFFVVSPKFYVHHLEEALNRLESCLKKEI